MHSDRIQSDEKRTFFVLGPTPEASRIGGSDWSENKDYPGLVETLDR